MYIRFCTSLGALVAPQYKRESPTHTRASAEKVISSHASICVRDLLPRLLHVLEAPHGVLQAVATEVPAAGLADQLVDLVPRGCDLGGVAAEAGRQLSQGEEATVIEGLGNEGLVVLPPSFPSLFRPRNAHSRPGTRVIPHPPTEHFVIRD